MMNKYYDSAWLILVSNVPVLCSFCSFISAHPVHINLSTHPVHIMPSFSSTSHESKPRRKQAHKVAGMNHLSIPLIGPSAQDCFLAACAAHSAKHLPVSSPTMDTPLLQQLGQIPGNHVHSTLMRSYLAALLQGNI